MLTSLFSSSARVKLLGLLLLNPAESFYLRQLARALRLPVRAIQRETERLVKAGLLKRVTDGNRVYFNVEVRHFLYPEIKRIFLKTLGALVLFGDALRSSPDIRVAFIHGSYAADEETAESDIDLFVVGELSARRLNAAFAKFRANTRRNLNIYVTNLTDFRAALSRRDGFTRRVMRSPKVFIVGDEHTLHQMDR